MKTISKLLLFLAVIHSVILMTALTCNAQNSVNSSIDVPSQVTQNKNFTLGLQIQCNKSVGVTIFTLKFGDALEYSSCKVNDNSNGYIVHCQENNVLKVTYVNTSGIDVSSAKTLIDVKMKATKIDKTWLEVYTTNSASIDEQALDDSECMRYDIEVVEKATSNSSAKGRATSKSSSSSKNSSIANNSNNKNITRHDNNSSEIPTSYAESNYDTVAVSGVNKSAMLFIAGGGFALAIVAVIFISYKAGKNNSTNVKKVNNTPKTGDTGEINLE